MNVAFLYADKARERAIGDAFTVGLKRHGINGEMIVLADKSAAPVQVDVACMFGVKSREVWQRYRKAGIQVIYFDKGYVRQRQEYWRVSVNAHNPTARLAVLDQPADRFRALALKLRPWRREGAQVVVAGSSAKYHAFHGLSDPTMFATRLAKQIGKWTGGREIIYRPKPSWRGATPIDGTTYSGGDRSIEQELAGAHALVTHGSNSCFEAMLMGIPTIVLGDAVARPISSTDLDEIEEPYIAEDGGRERLLANLAYFQWTLPEFGRGEAWEFLRSEVAAPPADPLYAEVCRLLGHGHTKAGETPQETLNRLFRKTCGDGVPTLSESNVAVALERRQIAELLPLARQVSGELPATTKRPVTIVRYLGREYLLDGSKRIAAWAERGRAKVYAYVLTVQ